MADATKVQSAKFHTVSDGAARSVAGPSSGGFADITTSTTDEAADLEDFVGHYVYIEGEIEDHWIGFSDDIAATIDITANTVADDDLVPRGVPAGLGSGIHVVVTRRYCIYRGVAGAGAATLRITRS